MCFSRDRANFYLFFANCILMYESKINVTFMPTNSCHLNHICPLIYQSHEELSQSIVWKVKGLSLKHEIVKIIIYFRCLKKEINIYFFKLFMSVIIVVLYFCYVMLHKIANCPYWQMGSIVLVRDQHSQLKRCLKNGFIHVQ